MKTVENRLVQRDPDLIFSRRIDWAVVIGASIVGTGLLLFSMFHRDGLITPVDPSVRGLAIGAGVFIGILLAAVATDAWKLGIGISAPPRGAMAMVSLVALVAACGFGGDMIASLSAEWRGFHGLSPKIQEREFVVTHTHRGTRSTDSIELRSGDGRTLTLNAFNDVLSAVRVGDRLLLPVEIGRDGAERTRLPNRAASLIRA